MKCRTKRLTQTAITVRFYGSFLAIADVAFLKALAIKDKPEERFAAQNMTPLADSV